MKSICLQFVVVVFFISSFVRADDSAKQDLSGKKTESSAEQLKTNPDDAKVFRAWLNETFTEISELMDAAPDVAEKKLATVKEFLAELKPESLAGRSQLAQAKQILANFEETLALSRVPLADLEKQVDEKPNDLNLLRKYSRKVSQEINPIARTEPEKAEALLKTAKARVEKLSEAATEKEVKTVLEQIERGFSAFARSIEHGHKIAALIGKPAPAWAVEEWANGSPLSADDLKGKVVLLDFWAIWCGPCIATFPHLREWQEKYSEKGLVIVGMTRYYNYKWDEESKKPVRGKEKDEVSHEEEQAMLKQFAEFHHLGHRFAIQTEEHSAAEDFVVNGIPHVVVIDRQGIVRMIRVGSGSKNAKAVHDMIEKLLADKPVAAKN